VYVRDDDELNDSCRLHTIFVSIECALFCLFVMAVSCDQLSAVFNDETAVEQVQRGRSSHASPRLSRRQLLSEVCGGGHWLCWLLPCRQRTQRARDLVHMPDKAPYDV